MQAIIKNPIITLDNNSDSIPNIDIASEFILLVNIITLSKNEYDLRSGNLLFNKNFNHFMFGFGGHHFWVKQLINGEPKQEVLFVNFD